LIDLDKGTVFHRKGSEWVFTVPRMAGVLEQIIRTSKVERMEVQNVVRCWTLTMVDIEEVGNIL
jgi:hypothetical protein